MKYVGWLLIFFVFAFIMISIHIGIARSGRVISQLQNEVAIKEARNQYEELEISRLSSPQEVTQFAEQNLGMVEVKPHQVIVLEGTK
ncbi:MAG: hypothetical protein J6Y25_03230 [Elusimicrobiaceae bacterium]|nr:hypothetical protein [Elusimicrobiaceae bacterium]MBP5616266.1 hypothetical protein [Elusimicrobiaceae bacterium]